MAGCQGAREELSLTRPDGLAPRKPLLSLLSNRYVAEASIFQGNAYFTDESWLLIKQASSLPRKYQQSTLMLILAPGWQKGCLLLHELTTQSRDCAAAMACRGRGTPQTPPGAGCTQIICSQSSPNHLLWGYFSMNIAQFLPRWLPPWPLQRTALMETTCQWSSDISQA